MLNLKRKIVLISLILLISNVNGFGNNYIGCYKDTNPSAITDNKGNNHTIQTCKLACKNGGKKYAALQNRGECRCTDTIPPNKADEIDCNRPCTANVNQICGGPQRNSVYHSELEVCSPDPNNCFTPINIQQCHDHLGNLNFNSIKNECEPFVQNDQQFYRFQLSFINGYVLDPNCLGATITFEGNEFIGLINLGGSFFDETGTFPALPNERFSFFTSPNSIKFTVRHLDLETLGCKLFTNDEEYEWQCNLKLHLYFLGVEQYEFSFCMKAFLPRITGFGDSTKYGNIRRGNPLTTHIVPNELLVTGDCCENFLKVQTILKYCTDFTCSSYLPSPLTVKRKQNIFLEHSITSPEFKYYYLEGLQISIGDFIPEIIKKDGSQKGRIIYQVQSNIAFNNLVITAISRLSETPTRLRNLAADTNQVGGDYKVKASSQIIVTEKKVDDKKDNDQKSKKNDLQETLLIVLLCLGSTIIISVGFFCLRVAYLRKMKNLMPPAEKPDSTMFDQQQPQQLQQPENRENIVTQKRASKERKRSIIDNIITKVTAPQRKTSVAIPQDGMGESRKPITQSNPMSPQQSKLEDDVPEILHTEENEDIQITH